MLEPLRDYDFRAVMLNALTDALTKIDKVKIAMPQRVEVVASDSSKRIAFDQSTASSILFCYVGYRLESGNLIVTASAEMYPKIERLKQFRNKPEEANPLDSGNVIYRKTFVFTKQAVTPITIKETQIRDRLAALAPEALDLLDESALHVGHAEATGGGHYRLKIISAQFAGQSHVARHRMVYAILEPLMRHRHIHALALVTQAPGES